ncbi:transposable element Tcb2 transposase [Trichonephila clavipes]|nr:transposable element Tcb2 transposase [Trichonephila clavipes]
MIVKLEEGRTVTNVAAKFGINKSVVSRSWRAFQTTGTAVRKVGGGRPRTTTAGDDQYILLQAKRGRRQSTSVIAHQLSTAVFLKVWGAPPGGAMTLQGGRERIENLKIF